MAKVMVGLSGGVDSAVAAALLVERGHEVTGGYMKNWMNDEGIPGDCPWEQDIEDARSVAKALGIDVTSGKCEKVSELKCGKGQSFVYLSGIPGCFLQVLQWVIICWPS